MSDKLHLKLKITKEELKATVITTLYMISYDNIAYDIISDIVNYIVMISYNNAK